MIIGCPECSTKFGIPDGALGDAGRKVRCAKCGHVWLATSTYAIEAALPVENTKSVSPPQETEDIAPPVSAPAPAPAPTPEPEPQVEEEVAVSDEGVEISESQNTQVDIKGLGDSTVEEALAVIKGSGIEEPDFPLAKGSIGEFEAKLNSKTVLIGWGALGVFLVSILLMFFLMQDSLRSAWPPITKLYDVVGMLHTDKVDNAEAEDKEPVDYSQYIRISNEAVLERLADGTPALVIRGSVTNTADFDIDLPSVAVVLRNERRQDILVWPFEFDETTLKGGKTMPFIEAVRSPPRETTEFELMLMWEK
jgi:predicted Zn finger-like uncharacterized protein